jgi:integrin alpha FG-GAP repeat containing protein 1
MYLYRSGRRRKTPLITLTTALALISPGNAFKLPWPFPAKRFTGNSLIDAGTMGLSGDNRVVAFGDFNGDQSYAHYLLIARGHLNNSMLRLDVLSLASDQQTLSVYHWSHGA